MRNMILLVDDDALLLRATVRSVRGFIKRSERSASVLEVSSPAEALELMRKHYSSDSDQRWCVITDFDMPGMNGATLLDVLNVELKERLLVRLVVSGREENRMEALRRKAAFAVKPRISKDIEQTLTLFFSKIR